MNTTLTLTFYSGGEKIREDKGGKYSEKENIFFSVGEEKQKRKRRKIFGEDLSKICLGLKFFANSWRVSVSDKLVSERKFRFWFRKISIRFGEFGLGYIVTVSESLVSEQKVSVSENLVLEKKFRYRFQAKF